MRLRPGANGPSRRSCDEALVAMPLPQRTVAASAHVNGGRVRLSRPAHEKVVAFNGARRNHFLHQVAAFADGVLEGSLITGMRERRPYVCRPAATLCLG